MASGLAAIHAQGYLLSYQEPMSPRRFSGKAWHLLWEKWDTSKGILTLNYRVSHLLVLPICLLCSDTVQVEKLILELLASLAVEVHCPSAFFILKLNDASLVRSSFLALWQHNKPIILLGNDHLSLNTNLFSIYWFQLFLALTWNCPPCWQYTHTLSSLWL